MNPTHMILLLESGMFNHLMGAFEARDKPQPHINQIVTLRDGRRASVYRLLWLHTIWVAFVVTAAGETSEVYL